MFRRRKRRGTTQTDGANTRRWCGFQSSVASRAALDNQWRLEQTLTQQSLVLKNATKKKKKFGLHQRDNKEF